MVLPCDLLNARAWTRKGSGAKDFQAGELCQKPQKINEGFWNKMRRWINYLLWEWTWCSRKINFSCQSNPFRVHKEPHQGSHMRACAQGWCMRLHRNQVMQGYWTPRAKAEPEAQKAIVSVQMKIFRKRLIYISNQHLSDSKTQACSVTPSCVPQQADRSPWTRQMLASSVLTTDCPLPLNTHRFFGLDRWCMMHLWPCYVYLIWGPLSLLEMISHWLRFKGNDTFIVGSERKVRIFPCTDETERLSQPFHHDRRLSGEAHGWKF